MSPGRDDFCRLRASFRTAGERRPTELRRLAFAFARQSVRFDVVGAQLASSIERAFARLAVAQVSEVALALRVDVWDEDDAGVPAPVRCEGVRSSDGGRLVVAGGPTWVGAYDRERCHLVAAIRNPAQVPGIDHARPLERLLRIWYGDHECQLLHAGMVVSPSGQGILLPGTSQSGKSTTVFACANGGFDALGDDCIAIARDSSGRYTGFSVFSALFVDRTTLRRFGGVGVPESNDARGRELVFPSTDCDAALRADATVAAIVLPRVTSGPASALTRVGRAEALRSMLRAAIPVDPRGMVNRHGFEALTVLLDHVPCYRLAAGSHLSAIPAAVAMALQATGGQCES